MGLAIKTARTAMWACVLAMLCVMCTIEALRIIWLLCKHMERSHPLFGARWIRDVNVGEGGVDLGEYLTGFDDHDFDRMNSGVLNPGGGSSAAPPQSLLFEGQGQRLGSGSVGPAGTSSRELWLKSLEQPKG